VFGVRQRGLPDIAPARDEALRIVKDNPKPKGERGEALSCLLYPFERDEAVPLMGAG
jgi:ATP-dependent DNA helicase RecG